METSLDSLTALRRDWHWRCHRTGSCEAAARFRDAHPTLPLTGVDDLGDLVGVLEVHGGRSMLERAAIVQAMLVDAADAEIRRALLQTLLPGVISVCRRLRFGQGVTSESGEFVGLALATTSEILAQWAGEDRPYAALDVLSALRGRLRRWILREKESAAIPTAAAATWAEPVSLDARLAAYLGGPHERLARLTYQRVYDERPWQALATAEHVSIPALQNELQFFARRYLV